ncbi:MAG: hypothetical protein KDK36_08060, partial [Leptospiraceae bacterium]|nr:hypothetical protein [Leptospiraceae bacterium]
EKILDSSLKGFVDKKNPYFDFRTNFNNFPYGISFFNYCGYSINPGFINLNFSIQSIGNNFSDLMVARNFNLDFDFQNSKLEPINEEEENKEFIESFPTNISQIKGGWSGYGPESYFRNVEIKSEEINLKGFGNTTKKGTEVFNFWGLKNGKMYSLNLTTGKGGVECQILKK